MKKLFFGLFVSFFVPEVIFFYDSLILNLLLLSDLEMQLEFISKV